MGRTFLRLGAINGFLAVAFGAFGAHALLARLTATGMVEVYRTAAQYHMTHALALLAVGMLLERGGETKLLRTSGWLFAVGIVLFSGSLYALSITGTRVLGAITPLGGLCFLAGWALLAVSVSSRS